MVLKQDNFDVISGYVISMGMLSKIFYFLLDIDSVRISGSFDITLGGIPSTRKIEVANPYSDERTFYLHTRNVFKRIESKEDGPLSQKSTVLCVKSGRSFINRPNE